MNSRRGGEEEKSFITLLERVMNNFACKRTGFDRYTNTKVSRYTTDHRAGDARNEFNMNYDIRRRWEEGFFIRHFAFTTCRASLKKRGRVYNISSGHSLIIFASTCAHSIGNILILFRMQAARGWRSPLFAWLLNARVSILPLLIK